MRDPKRIKRILSKLEKLWNETTDWRLGQVLENYIFTEGERGDQTSVRMFYQEDDKTEKILDKMIEKVPVKQIKKSLKDLKKGRA